MKMIDLATEEAAKNAYNEPSMLERLKHPNIVSFYDTFVLKETLYLVMEYCEEGKIFCSFLNHINLLTGDLQKKVKETLTKDEYFGEEQVQFLIRQ